MLVYSFDIGGSSIKHGLVDIVNGKASIVARGETIMLPNNSFSYLKGEILKVISSISNLNEKIDIIGLSTTGSVDPYGKVVNAGHFDGYTNISWDDIINKEYHNDFEVKVINDGRASAWGEYFAYGRSYKTHVHVVVGTGVGGGIIYSDKLLLGDSGFSGYIGHIKISLNDTITCSCGKKGCVETLASVPAIIEFYRKHSDCIQPKTFKEIIELATSGEHIAIQALEEAGYWLGVGIGCVLNVLNPSLVSVGGGVPLATTELLSLNQGDLYFESLLKGAEQSAHKRVFVSSDIKKAVLGNDAGLIGAACLASLRRSKYH